MHLLELLKKTSAGDERAKEKLIASYNQYIFEMVVFYKASFESKYKMRCELENEELFQEGVIGLLKAVNESSFWAKFSNYARKAIDKEIKLAIFSDLAFRVFLSELKDEFRIYREKRAELFCKLKRSPTPAEMARATRFDLEKIERLEIFYKIALEYENELC